MAKETYESSIQEIGRALKGDAVGCEDDEYFADIARSLVAGAFSEDKKMVEYLKDRGVKDVVGRLANDIAVYFNQGGDE